MWQPAGTRCDTHKGLFPPAVVSQLNKYLLKEGHFFKSHLNVWGLCSVIWEVVIIVSGCRGAVGLKGDCVVPGSPLIPKCPLPQPREDPGCSLKLGSCLGSPGSLSPAAKQHLGQCNT